MQHPRYEGVQSYYLLTSGGQLCQVNAHVPHKDKGSWFVGENVHSDGRFYMATPVDPLFMVLPVLEANSGALENGGEGRFCRRDQILMHDAWPGIHELFPVTETESGEPAPVDRDMCVPDLDLSPICDARDEGQSVSQPQALWRLSESKVMAWLETKIERVTTFMALEGVDAAVSAVSSGTISGFVSSTRKRKRKDTTSGMTLAADLLNEFLSEKRAKALQVTLGLATAAGKRARPLDGEGDDDDDDDSPGKGGSVAPKQDYSKIVSKKVVQKVLKRTESKKERDLKKSAKGSKSMLDFFKKK